MARIQFIPRIYQRLMIEFLLMKTRCALWAEMGLGKTVAVLTALDILFFLKEETKPALIIAPLRVAKTTWPEEALKWDHLKNIIVQPIIGDAAERKAALRNRRANVFTINYENLPWLIAYLGKNWPFGIIVADESTKLKSFRLKQGGKRAQALASVAWSKCSRFWQLTGTPSPNGLADLWGQIWFLDGGERLCRSYSAFKQRWFNEDREHFKLEIRPGADVEIQDKLKDICLSLRAADYFDIKKPIEITRFVDLPPAARAKYDEMEKQMYIELKEIFRDRTLTHAIEAVNSAAKTMKCLQLANGAAYIEEDNKKWVEVHDLKLQALEEIIEEAAGMPVLVAYHFKSDLARLLKAFPQARQLDDNPKTITAWNKGKIPVLLSHPASAGHGLNLQHGGNIIAVFANDWNLENYLQILERIGPVRQMQSGYDRPVFIYPIIARDTVEELVIARRKNKRSIQDLLMESMKQKGKI